MIKPILRVAKVLLYDSEGYVLVLWRSNTHPHYPLEADLPGGIIERGESYEAGLVREMQEEIGVTVTPDDLKWVATRDGKLLTVKQLYEIRLAERPAITISWEHDRYEWVKETELLDRLRSHDDYIAFVRRFLTEK